MNVFKSHFWYDKSQRNGILFLILLILLVQIISFWVHRYPEEVPQMDSSQIIAFQKQIDSLKAIEIERRKPKIFPFNPNYITDGKAAQLGISVLELDRLLKHRKAGKFVNSKKEFQQVTKVSDSLLASISNYFKFPVWVENRNRLHQKNRSEAVGKNIRTKRRVELATTNLNAATVLDFQFVHGIDVSLAERIVRYRSKLQGFSMESQLYEVYNMDAKSAQNLLKIFQIIEKPTIQKVNINTLNFKQLLAVPYMDYELCKKILNYRDEVAELQSLSELKNINEFPLEKYDRIALYLKTE